MIEAVQFTFALGGLFWLVLNAVAFRRYAFTWDDDPLSNMVQGMFWVSTFAALRLFWWDVARSIAIFIHPDFWDFLNVWGVAVNILFNAGVMFGCYRKGRGLWLMLIAQSPEMLSKYPTVIHAAFYPRSLSLFKRSQKGLDP